MAQSQSQPVSTATGISGVTVLGELPCSLAGDHWHGQVIVFAKGPYYGSTVASVPNLSANNVRRTRTQTIAPGVRITRMSHRQVSAPTLFRFAYARHSPQKIAAKSILDSAARHSHSQVQYVACLSSGCSALLCNACAIRRLQSACDMFAPTER